MSSIINLSLSFALNLSLSFALSFATMNKYNVELFDENRRWQSRVYKDVRSKKDAEKRLALLLGDRERGRLSLPGKKTIPTLREYCNKYLELSRNDKENNLLRKKRAIRVINGFLGNYQLEKITGFIIERFRIDRNARDSV